MKFPHTHTKLLISTFILFFLVFSGVVYGDTLISAAQTDPSTTPSLPEQPFDYAGIVLPDHYLSNAFQAGRQNAAIDNDNTPADNPITNEGATLGRVLFYDTKLSANGTIACASCHLQEHGFADPNQFSIGFGGGTTRRHSMGLVNARFYEPGKFFWDERAATLEDQVLMPFQDSVEMGLTLEQLVQIVQNQPYYAPLFEDAFGDDTITSDRISKALAQFVRSIVSVNSKYDQGRVEVQNPMANFSNFTPQENMGKRLFFAPGGGRTPCLGCHISEAFVAPPAPNPAATTSATNNGLDAVSTDDLGVFETTGNNADIGKFKVPSLRNVGVREPYMHDGRFDSLEEVVEHYSSGIQNHPTLHPTLRNGNGTPANYNFTEEEKAAVVAFLHTLTDEDLIDDEKFSNPFQDSTTPIETQTPSPIVTPAPYEIYLPLIKR